MGEEVRRNQERISEHAIAAFNCRECTDTGSMKILSVRQTQIHGLRK